MANEEHLRILREGGVDRWNQWRKENPDINPDLTDRNFSGIDLSYFNFRNTVLWRCNFSNSSLRGTVLIRAFLQNTYFLGTDLTGADLRQASLTEGKLERAILRDADLREADLTTTNLSGAILVGAKLIRTNLTKTYLVGANFKDADLTEANLFLSTAAYTDFEEATLTGACIHDWSINERTNFNNITCEYIFLKLGVTNEPEERRPSDRTKIFAPGDFARLVRKSLETVDLIFSNGIDWKALAISLEALRVQYGGQDLSIQAIENKNDAFVIRLNVPPDTDKGAIERQAKEFYETRLAVLEAQYRSTLQAKDREIEIYREKSADMTEIVKLLANRPIEVKAIAVAENKPIENYSNDLRGANIANYANKLDGNAGQQAKQYNYTAEQKQTLAEAAADIQQLLEQLSQTYPTTTQAEKLAVAAKAAEEIEANPVLRSRVIGALKAGGVEALKELVDHPLVTILLAALEGWQKPE